MASSGANVTIVQHMHHLAARIHAVVHKVNSLSDQLEELKAGMGGSSGSAEAISALRDEIKRDVIRERAMMEASLEHRIDQQLNRLMIDKDQSASISRLERRADSVDSTLVRLDERLSELKPRAAAAKTASKQTTAQE